MIERRTWIGKFWVMYRIKRDYYGMGILKSVKWAIREVEWWKASDKRKRP